MIHQRGCPIINRTPFNDHSDAAKRIADTYNLHRVADPYGNIGYWIACSLEDGTSDNTLYESKPAAIKHQHHNENWFVFLQIVPASFTACEAEVFLKQCRMLYAKGGRMTDGFSRHELIRRLGWEDQIAQSRGIVQNLEYGRN